MVPKYLRKIVSPVNFKAPIKFGLKSDFQFRNEGEVVVDRFCKEKRFWKFLKIRREKMWFCLPWWKLVKEGNFTKAELLRTLGNFQSSSSTRTAASEGINCKIVERFTNYILAENTYFTNLMQWREHKIMVLKPSDKYRIKILFRVIVSSL